MDPGRVWWSEVLLLLLLLLAPASFVHGGDIVHEDDEAPKLPGCSNDFVLVKSPSRFFSWFCDLMKSSCVLFVTSLVLERRLQNLFLSFSSGCLIAWSRKYSCLSVCMAYSWLPTFCLKKKSIFFLFSVEESCWQHSRVYNLAWYTPWFNPLFISASWHSSIRRAIANGRLAAVFRLLDCIGLHLGSSQSLRIMSNCGF